MDGRKDRILTREGLPGTSADVGNPGRKAWLNRQKSAENPIWGLPQGGSGGTCGGPNISLAQHGKTSREEDGDVPKRGLPSNSSSLVNRRLTCGGVNGRGLAAPSYSVAPFLGTKKAYASVCFTLSLKKEPQGSPHRVEF